MLPRLADETGTIKVNLKRKLQYKSSALSLNVRPNKVVQAAKWLVENSSLYREENISFSDSWLESRSNILLTVDEGNNETCVEKSQNICDTDNCKMQCTSDDEDERR